MQPSWTAVASVAGILAGVAGCRGDSALPDPVVAAPEPPDGARSGSRLKLVHWQTDDGFTLSSRTLYDAQLDTLCQVMPWGDGRLVCVPVGRPSVVGGAFGSDPLEEQAAFLDSPNVKFLDENCTRLAAQVSGPPPRYAVLAPFDPDCAGPGVSVGSAVEHVYRLGAEITGSPDVFQRNGTSCEPWLDRRDDATLYAVEDVPPADLVAILRYIAPSSERITTTYHVSSDGMQLPAHAHDNLLGADCDFRRKGRLLYVCLPSEAVHAPEPAVMACGRAAVPVPARCRRPAAQYPPFDVYDPRSLFRIGDRTEESCTPADGLVYYELGDEVPVATATAEPERDTGRRFELHYLTAGGWRGRSAYSLHDNKYGVDCDLVASGPDTGYCSARPSCGELRRVFPDPGCHGEPVTMFQHVGCDDALPGAVDRREIVDDSQVIVDYTEGYIEENGELVLKCHSNQVSSLYPLGPDAIPLDELTLVIDRD